MVATPLSLTEQQIKSFDNMLLHGTSKTLSALEGMFGLKIDRSSSSIELAPANASESIKKLGNKALYVVSSAMAGDLQGQILLLMRESDFQCLGEVMRPILCLLFLSSPEDDLATLESRKPEWMREDGCMEEKEAAFYEVMIDLFGELGNVLMSIYTRAMGEHFDVNTHHSLPQPSKDPDQQALGQILSLSSGEDYHHMIIEHELDIDYRTVRLWFMISPTRQSFQNALDRIESRDQCEEPFGTVQPALSA